MKQYEIDIALELLQEAMEEGQVTIEALDKLLEGEAVTFYCSIQGYIDEQVEEDKEALKAWNALGRV